ncbi:alpha/beta hydrolase-fold protein [Phycicoccus flavus]|uniref:Esterase family protein n=1 Tax=Phycicoccus flavus TaxID=2502783 RepID=A0A8T6R7I2_9MICO|nr:alpha/beta hydrolase-fold protein [Phycicoccus flavus]NHA69826.1 esterase family protein [Phycicoccus flavus]
MTRPRRRAVLAGGLAAFVTGLTGCGTDDPPGVTVSSGTLRSAHLPGRDLAWVLAAPDDADVRRAPVVVLHGKGGSARSTLDTLHLQDHVAATGLAVAAVDGGDGYWHARADGTDSGAMVLEDFLPLLAREYGETDRVSLLGWSMGGYGSLLLASRLGPDRVVAVVAESAALWTDPGLSAPGAFDDREDFLAHDVFARRRLATLARLPVRLDCGADDPFVAANRAFAAALPSAGLTVDPGAHTGDYWRSHGGPQLEWLRARTDAAASA